MAAPVRVAFDAGPLFGHRTGIGAAVAALAGALDARDDVERRPYVLSFRARPAPPTARWPLPAAVAQRLWSRVDHPRLGRWLGDADLVHGTNHVVPPTRRPRLVSVYDAWFLANPEHASADVRRAADVLVRAVDHGAHVHTSSAASAARLRALLDTDRVHVVHLAPLPAPPSSIPGRPPRWAAALAGRPVVAAIGTIEKRKNTPGLVDAFGRLAARVADVQLVVAGAPGDDVEAFGAAIAALPGGVAERVHRPGIISTADKTWLLANASALAYPSLDEGFGFPLLEAQAAGLPVVATRVGSIPEVGGAGVSLVDVGAPDDLADALERVITDGGHRAELVAAGRANLPRFSWEDTAASMVALYRRLVEAGA